MKEFVITLQTKHFNALTKIVAGIGKREYRHYLKSIHVLQDYVEATDGNRLLQVPYDCEHFDRAELNELLDKHKNIVFFINSYVVSIIKSQRKVLRQVNENKVYQFPELISIKLTFDDDTVTGTIVEPDGNEPLCNLIWVDCTFPDTARVMPSSQLSDSPPEGTKVNPKFLYDVANEMKCNVSLHASCTNATSRDSIRVVLVGEDDCKYIVMPVM